MYISSLGTVDDDALQEYYSHSGASVQPAPRGGFAQAGQIGQQGTGLAGTLLSPGTIDLLLELLVIGGGLYMLYRLLTRDADGKSSSVVSAPASALPVAPNPDDSSCDTPPRTGKNAVARVSRAASGAWYYKLLRKGARRHGPFATRSDLECVVAKRGIRLME